MSDSRPAVRNIQVTREHDDKLALRASIGGRAEFGYYLLFRGDPAEVLAMLEDVILVARAALPTGKYKDKRGTLQG